MCGLQKDIRAVYGWIHLKFARITITIARRGVVPWEGSAQSSEGEEKSIDKDPVIGGIDPRK